MDTLEYGDSAETIQKCLHYCPHPYACNNCLEKAPSRRTTTKYIPEEVAYCIRNKLSFVEAAKYLGVTRKTAVAYYKRSLSNAEK